MRNSSTLILILLTLSIKAQNLEWARGMGGTGVDMGHTIAVDNAGNVYSTGIFNGAVDFDPGPGVFTLTSAGSWDIFIQKIDDQGVFQWAHRVGSAGDDRGQSIATDGVNVYLTGFYSMNVDFDPGPGTFVMNSAGAEEAFIMKLDVAGNFGWAKRMGGSGDDRGMGIALDAASNPHVTGYFMNNVNGIANLNSSGQYDIFILKLSSAGNLIWSKKMGSSGIDQGNGITVSSNGNVYSTGTFQVTVDFNPGGGNANLSVSGGNYWDIYIQKLDASGNFVWAKRMGDQFEDRGQAITTDLAENVYTTGFFYDTTDFDPGPGTHFLIAESSRDVFIQKLDAAGNFVWARDVGGMFDIGYSIDVDVNGNVYTTGHFAATGDFDPGPGVFNMTANGQDIFLLKLDPFGNFVWALKFGSGGGDGGYASTTAVNGSVYASGYFWNTTDFDPGPGTVNLTAAGATDVFIIKLNELQVPLPVEYLTFTAEAVDNKKVLLNWKTATEINNDYFTVERSVDAHHWEFVNETDGAGNSNSIIEYTAWDENPHRGISYYRLKQTDFDGQFKYSDVVAVRLTDKINFTIYPNPAMDIVTVTGDVDVINVYDVTGRLCSCPVVKTGIWSSQLDLSLLCPGSYFIRASEKNGKTLQMQLVKL